MNEEELISFAVGALRANPRAAVIVGALVALVSIIGNGWQLVSKEKREALRVARPRLFMFFEVMASLSLLVVRAARVVKYAGKPRESERPSAPSDPPPASPGFSDASVMRFVAAVSLVVIALCAWCGCAAATPHVQAIPPSIVQREAYGTCAETGGKIEVPNAGVVALLTSVCWRPMDASAPSSAPDASAEPEAIVDKSDSGAVGHE